MSKNYFENIVAGKYNYKPLLAWNVKFNPFYIFLVSKTKHFILNDYACLKNKNNNYRKFKITFNSTNEIFVWLCNSTEALETLGDRDLL